MTAPGEGQAAPTGPGADAGGGQLTGGGDQPAGGDPPAGDQHAGDHHAGGGQPAGGQQPPGGVDKPPGGGQPPVGGDKPPGGGDEPADGGEEAPDVAAPALSGAFDSGVGGSPVGSLGITLVAGLIIATIVFALYCLVAIWPPTSTGTAETAATPSHVVGIQLMLDREQRLFVVVALAGALGGLIHSARSLSAYVGNRILRRSWLLMYISLPFVSGALAVVFYVILRGGLITGTAAEVNFFGFAAISALVGLFSFEAAEKLKQLFSTLLAHVPHERDSLAPGMEATVYGIEPRRGPIGTEVTIRGRCLSGTTSVRFGNAQTIPVYVADTQVRCTVPAGAMTSRPCLIVGEVLVYAPAKFRVTR